MTVEVLDLFAGPGGWDLGARELGVDPYGLELDADACATRRAAGLRTAQVDVTGVNRPPPFRVTGLIASPPCQQWSRAGKGEARGADPGWLYHAISLILDGSEISALLPDDAPSGLRLVPDPGANANRFNGATKSRNDGIAITVQEALVLQGFPADYPVQGTKSSQIQQVGNAIPPPLARALLAQVL